MKMPKFFKLPKAPKLPPWMPWVGVFLVIFVITSLFLGSSSQYGDLQLEDKGDGNRSFQLLIDYAKKKDDVVQFVYGHDTWGNETVTIKRRDSLPMTAGVPAGQWSVVQAVADEKHIPVDGTFKMPKKVALHKASPAQEILAAFGPILLLMGVWYYFSKKMNPMMGKNNKPKHRMVKAEDIKETLNDFAGHDEIKEDVIEYIDFLRDPKGLMALGGTVPKGVLMVGPPGNGKTLLARCIAGEAKVPFFTVSGSDFVEMFVGVGASRVRALFEDAKKHAPCIIFIDEIDAIGRQRGGGVGGGNDERHQTLDQILVEMDGFDQTSGVFVIAATNRADILDKALLRPGRFDQQVTVGMPDLDARKKILTVHMKGKKLGEGVSIDHIANSSWNFSGAALKGLLNRATILMYKRIVDAEKRKLAKVEPVISKEDIETALMEGAMKSTMAKSAASRQDPLVKTMLSYHEGGHGLVTEYGYRKWLGSGMDWGQQWGKALRRLTIIGAANTGGHMQATPDMDTMVQSFEALLGDIACALAATISERLYTGTATTGNSGDLNSAYETAKMMVTKVGMSQLGPLSVGEDMSNPNLGAVMGRGGAYGQSEKSSKQIDHEIGRLLAGGARIAIRALMEREEFLHALVDELMAKETIARADWVVLWDKFDSKVITDAEVEATFRRTWPGLAALFPGMKVGTAVLLDA